MQTVQDRALQQEGAQRIRQHRQHLCCQVFGKQAVAVPQMAEEILRCTQRQAAFDAIQREQHQVNGGDPALYALRQQVDGSSVEIDLCEARDQRVDLCVGKMKGVSIQFQQLILHAQFADQFGRRRMARQHHPTARGWTALHGRRHHLLSGWASDMLKIIEHNQQRCRGVLQSNQQRVQCCLHTILVDEGFGNRGRGRDHCGQCGSETGEQLGRLVVRCVQRQPDGTKSTRAVWLLYRMYTLGGQGAFAVARRCGDDGQTVGTPPDQLCHEPLALDLAGRQAGRRQLGRQHR